MQAVIYTRISKDLREGAGVARQEKACRELCDKKGYDVREVLSDNDTSAFSGKKRPGYERLLELAGNGGVDVVVCWHTDRLYRRLADLEGLIEACKENAVLVETVEGGGLDLNTASGRMLAGILAVHSRHEVDHQIERQRAAHADRAARGRYRGGPVSFGFRTVPGKPGHLDHEPEEAAAIRFAADEILAGKSLQSIAKRWLERGVVAKGSQTPWSAAKVRKRMSSPRIAGLEPYKGQLYPATTYEAIIPEAKWRAVMGVLESNETTRTRGTERRHLGTGIFRCGVCGGRMSTIKRPRRGEATRAYACQSCTKISRKMDNVDELVESVLLGYLDQERNRVPLIRKDTDDGGSLQDLLDEQRGLEARQNELATMFAEGHLTAAQLRAGTAKLEAKVDNLNKKIRQAREANPLSVMLLAGDDLRTTWERLAPTQKSRIVDELMSVTIMPTRRGKFDPSAIRIEWKD